MKQTPNGMKREDKSEKPRYFHYLPPEVLERYGVHMLEGAKKHGSGNFLKGGYGKENWLDSLYRHLLALKKGQTDEDHAMAILFNIVGYAWEEHIEE